MPAKLWGGGVQMGLQEGRILERCEGQIGLARIGVAGAPKCTFRDQRTCSPYKSEVREETPSSQRCQDR